MLRPALEHAAAEAPQPGDLAQRVQDHAVIQSALSEQRQRPDAPGSSPIILTVATMRLRMALGLRLSGAEAILSDGLATQSVAKTTRFEAAY